MKDKNLLIVKFWKMHRALRSKTQFHVHQKHKVFRSKTESEIFLMIRLSFWRKTLSWSFMKIIELLKTILSGKFSWKISWFSKQNSVLYFCTKINRLNCLNFCEKIVILKEKLRVEFWLKAFLGTFGRKSPSLKFSLKKHQTIIRKTKFRIF